MIDYHVFYYIMGVRKGGGGGGGGGGFDGFERPPLPQKRSPFNFTLTVLLLKIFTTPLVFYMYAHTYINTFSDADYVKRRRGSMSRL